MQTQKWASEQTGLEERIIMKTQNIISIKGAHIQVDTCYGSYCLFVNFTLFVNIIKYEDGRFTSQNLWRFYFS